MPPSARYTAVLDLEWTARSPPLVLTSQSRGSVEMTHVEGRHRLREYGVFTRFLIFSPDPDLPSCADSPTENKSTRDELYERTSLEAQGLAGYNVAWHAQAEFNPRTTEIRLVCICNPSTVGAEAGGSDQKLNTILVSISYYRAQPELHKTLTKPNQTGWEKKGAEFHEQVQPVSIDPNDGIFLEICDARQCFSKQNSTNSFLRHN